MSKLYSFQDLKKSRKTLKKVGKSHETCKEEKLIRLLKSFIETLNTSKTLYSSIQEEMKKYKR